MLSSRFVAAGLLSTVATFVPCVHASTLDAPTTLPITFTRSVRADRAHTGDPVEAKTIQRVVLAEGQVLRVGSVVHGHVVQANGFDYDKTPYAHQKPSALTIQFDSVEVDGKAIPLNVTVRAMAGAIAVSDALSPPASDMDPKGTRTQIGGDQVTPSLSEVTNAEGDVVAYNHRDGVYAHLIANGPCDGSDVEVSVAMYSASACGGYGLGNMRMVERGTPEHPSTLTLVSPRDSPEITKHSTALLEVLPQQQALLGR